MSTATGQAATMGGVDALRELRARIEKATGPDRILDVRILAGMVEPGRWSAADIEYACGAPERTCKPPYYTDSVDVALALMERVLPGWDVLLYHDEGQYVAEMTWPDGTDIGEAAYFGIIGRAPTRPLAILCGVADGCVQVAYANATPAALAQSQEARHAD